MSLSQDARQPQMVDLVFAVRGRQIPLDYRWLLWNALRPVLPWLESEPQAGIVGVRLTPTGAETALLPQRAKLTLRVPLHRAPAARELVGARLGVGGEAVEIGAADERALRASATLYAAFVALDDGDELAFGRALAAELGRIEADCRAILGRRRTMGAGARPLVGFPVALHGCKPAQSLRLQVLGVGAERGLGCGIFVPHKTIEPFE
jgi:CRISPR-associated protein Cas6